MDSNRPTRPRNPSIAEFDPLAELIEPSSSPSSAPKTLVFTSQIPSSPIQTHHRQTSAGRRNGIRYSPTSPDFGDFVQASTVSNHPLLSDTGVPAEDILQNEDGVLSASPNKNEFNRFTENAKARNLSNERRLLQELKEHDENYMPWNGNFSKGTGAAIGEEREDKHDKRLISDLQEAGSTIIDLSASPIQNTSSPSADVHNSHKKRLSLPRATSESSLIGRRSSPSSEPSLPSSTTNTSLTKNWMSTLLSSAQTASTSSSASSAIGMHSPDLSHSSNDPILSTSPTKSRLQALFSRSLTQSPPLKRSPSPSSQRHSRFVTEGHPPVHAATMPSSFLSGLPTSHIISTPGPSPFSSHSYIPPSGAPGFVGEKNWNSSAFDFDESKNTKRSIDLRGRKDSTLPVLTPFLADLIRPHLPALARLPHKWDLLYSTDQDGLSLSTLYNLCTPQQVVGGGGKLPGLVPEGALLAMQDAEGGVFGAWVGEGLHLSHGSYYGGGDSFLWRVDPHDNREIQVYKWTGRNDYVALCERDGISFGGGEGHYGLYVEENLLQGTTHPCPTFDNDCLAQGQRHGLMVSFDCTGIEVWGIGR